MVKKLMSAGVANVAPQEHFHFSNRFAQEKLVAKETGLHAFVASKAIKSAQKFSEDELINYSYEMLKIYHEERRGISELEIEFEKLLIN